MPAISVVIPVYNVAQYLRECLDSVRNQTFRDIEIICINDGSTDGSLDILLDYQKKDSRFQVFSQPNAGPSASRNKGLDLARGKYVYCLDSDDMIVGNALEELYSMAEKDRLDHIVFTTGLLLENEDRCFQNQTENMRIYYSLADHYCGQIMSGMELLTTLLLNNNYFVSPPLRFLRLEPLKENACRFPVGLIHEDNYFSAKALLAASRACAVNRKFYIRRVRPCSIMTASNQEQRHFEGYLGTMLLLLQDLSQKKQNADEKEGIALLFDNLLQHCLQAFYLASAVMDREKLSVPEQVQLQPENLFLAENLLLPLFAKQVQQRCSAEHLLSECRTLSRKLDLAVAENQRQKELLNSFSFHCGRAVTWCPRMIRNFTVSLRDLGIRKTFSRVIQKVLALKKRFLG